MLRQQVYSGLFRSRGVHFDLPGWGIGPDMSEVKALVGAIGAARCHDPVSHVFEQVLLLIDKLMTYCGR